MSITPGHAKWLQDLVREWYHARKAWLDSDLDINADRRKELFRRWEDAGDALAKAYEEIGD